MNKRLFFAVISLLAFVSPAMAQSYDFSATAPSGQTLYYTILDASSVSVEAKDSDIPTGDLVIPPSVTYGSTTYNVTSIRGGAFHRCSNLTTIDIPSSVTSIGGEAFFECSGLTTITIPSSVTSIGQYAFLGCSGLTLMYVESGNTIYDSRGNCNAIIETATNTIIAGCMNTVIPSSVTSIGDYAFFFCTGLTYINIPNSLTTISEGAFQYCRNLISINIPSSVTTIGEGAFMECNGLTSVSIPESITYIDEGTFANCSSLTSIVCLAAVPPTIVFPDAFYNVPTNIPVYVPCGSVADYQVARDWNNFTNIQAIDAATVGKMPITTEGLTLWYTLNSTNHTATVVTQNDNSPYYETLPTGALTIPSTVSYCGEDYTVTTIGDNAFRSCTGLTSVVIPGSVTTIGNRAFGACRGLEKVTIPNSVVTLGFYAFSGCDNIITATIGNLVDTIRYGAFMGCVRLENLTIGSSVKYIGVEAFRNCTGLGTVNIPNSVTVIAMSAFQECSGITSVTIGNSVTTVGPSAFASCSSMTTLRIGTAVTTIENSAFAGCSALTSIRIHAVVPPTLGSGVMNDVPTNIPIYVPCGALADYQAANRWNTFTDIQESIPYILTVRSNNQEMGTATVIQEASCTDNTAHVGAITNSGCVFVRWSDGSTYNPRVVTVTSDTLLVAEFASLENNWDPTVVCPGWNNPESFTTNNELYYYSGQKGEVISYVPSASGHITGINFTVDYSASQLATATGSHTGDCGQGDYQDYAYVIMNAADGTDPNTGNNLPIVPTQFNTIDQEINTHLLRSIRIGNLCGGREAHALYYTMRVTENNALINLYYALVTEFGDHSAASDSRFIYRVTHRNGTVWQPVSSLPNGYISLTTVNNGGNITIGEDGWNSNGSGRGSIVYKDWTKVNIDLSEYIGEDVRIEVMVADCANTQHYAYAYIAGDCRPASVIRTVAATSDNGGYGTVAGGGAYATGETVTLTATSNCESRFVRWKNTNDETVSTDNPYTFTANDDVTLIAEFSNLWTAVCSTGQTLVYTIDCNTHTATVVGYVGTCSGNLVIPASVSFANESYDVTAIGDEAFYHCTELTSVTIPSSITTVGYDVFTGCSGLESANYTGTVAQWCNIDFHNSGSTSTNYSHSININGASVSELEIPFDVIRIGVYAFYNCTDLTSVTIPSTVTSIGMFAFYNCSGLTEIYCLASVPPTLDVYAFEGVPTNIPVYVPCGAVAAYRAAEGWSRFTNIQEVGGCPTIGAEGVDIYADGNAVVIEGAAGNTVTLYDNNGTVVATSTATTAPVRFENITAGTYFVKIGILPVRMKVEVQ